MCYLIPIWNMRGFCTCVYVCALTGFSALDRITGTASIIFIFFHSCPLSSSSSSPSLNCLIKVSWLCQHTRRLRLPPPSFRGPLPSIFFGLGWRVGFLCVVFFFNESNICFYLLVYPTSHLHLSLPSSCFHFNTTSHSSRADNRHQSELSMAKKEKLHIFFFIPSPISYWSSQRCGKKMRVGKKKYLSHFVLMIVRIFPSSLFSFLPNSTCSDGSCVDCFFSVFLFSSFHL